MGNAFEKQQNKPYEALLKKGVSVFTYTETDSTNSEAKRHALSGGSSPALFVADGQTAGRGRMGRSFYSPASTGIYLSLLLRAPESNDHTLRMTSAAAVAAHDGIFEVLGIDTGIKWVNDLYLNGRKIAGILAESFFVEALRYVVIGIGINLSTSDFPEELCDKAGALIEKGDADVKQKLTEAVASHLYDEICDLEDPTIIERYRKHSAVLGKNVTFTENGITREGIAEGIDDLGALYVRLADGTLCRLGSGEISLRIDR